MIDIIPYRWFRLIATIGLTIFLYYAMHQGYTLVILQDSIWYELVMPLLFMMFFISAYYVDPNYLSMYLKRSHRVFFNVFIQDTMRSIADFMIWYLSIGMLFVNAVDSETFQYTLLYDMVLYYGISMLSLAVTQQYFFAVLIPILWFLMPLITFQDLHVTIPFRLYTLHELTLIMACSIGLHLIKLIKIYLR